MKEDTHLEAYSHKASQNITQPFVEPKNELLFSQDTSSGLYPDAS
jgi:hypothetical protein